MDPDIFLNSYFDAITEKFKDLVPPADMKAHILSATEAMIRDNRPDKTNQDVFMEHFLPRVNRTAEELTPIFAHFYTNEFKRLRASTSPAPTASKVVEKLAGKGYRLVLATNPIFPREAILERMRWAGVEQLPWELVTAYEECHYCKPNPSYYAEILDKLGLAGGRTLMVGNDTREDLIASTQRIKTYLATDNLLDRGDSPWRPDLTGRLAELPHHLGIT